jgi:holo-ACP synthase/triphosphoribosyl-dephospho-CoA synthase
MTSAAVAADWASMKNIPEEQLTAGQRLYRRYGLTGIRGEVAAGLPGVIDTSLPTYRRALAAGRNPNADAGAIALLHLIARGTDTNMIHRGGIALAAEAAEKVRDLLQRDPMPEMNEIAELDKWFIERNLSPGGCADLLAVTYFLHSWALQADYMPMQAQSPDKRF